MKAKLLVIIVIDLWFVSRYYVSLTMPSISYVVSFNLHIIPFDKSYYSPKCIDTLDVRKME